MTKSEFIDYVMNHGGVQNDDKYVYVSTPAGQSEILVTEVLGRIENYPFEASYYLESDFTLACWEDLYEDYMESETFFPN